MPWEPSKPHKTGKGQRSTLGPTHTDIQYRNSTTGKVDKSRGKGKVSGVSRKTSFLDSLSGTKKGKR